MALEFGFNANEPGSYDAMELRKRIALAMAGQKKAFPKNIGEGLSSIGQSIDEAFTMRALERQQAALDASRTARQASEDAAATGKRGEAVTGDTVADIPDSTDTTDVGARVAAVTPPPVAAPVAAPTRSLAPLVAQAPPPDAPIRTNPNGTIAGNLTAPTTPPAPPMPAPMPPPDAGSSPYEMRAGVPYSMWGGVTPEQNPALAAGLGAAAARMAPSASAVPADGRRSDLGDPGADGVYPPTASLDASSGTLPVGRGVSQRDAIARLLSGGSDTLGGPGVPQPNPTPAAASPPSSLTAIQAGSPPEAAGNRPIVMPDVTPASAEPVPVAGAQLAQRAAVPVPVSQPAPQPMLTPGPVAPTDPAIANKPTEPPPPQPEPRSQAQKYYETKMATEQDPVMRQFYQGRIAPLEAERARRDAVNMKKYESDRTLFDQNFLQWQQRNSPLGQAQTTEAQSKASTAADAAVLAARVGQNPETFLTNFAKERDSAEKTVNILKQSKLAKEAVNNGIVTGFGADFRLNVERLKAWMLNNKAAGNIASNSEQMLAAVKSTLGNAIQNIQGQDPRVTDADARIAAGTIGADPKLQEATIRKLIDQTILSQHQRLNEYEDKKDYYLGGTKVERGFDIRTDETAPQPYIDRLLEHKDNDVARKRFDDRFGQGAAELEIARAKRQARRPRGD